MASLIAGKLGGIGEAFADRNFRIYTIGSVLSWLSFFVQAVAVSWTAWELTHSTTWLATIALLDIAPNLIFIPLGGVLADRFDRYAIMMLSYIAALLQALALTILAYAGMLTITALAMLCFLHGLIHSFSIPATYGLLPRFVAREKLSSAIGVAAAYTQFAIFAGPALAGWIIVNFGAAAAYASNVVGYVIFLVCALFLRTPPGHQAPVTSGRSIMGDAIEGVLYVFRHAGISAMLMVMLISEAITASLYKMLPAFADKVLDAGVGVMSTLLSAAGLGATLAALWIAHGGASRTSPKRILWAVFVFALTVIALMMAKSLFVATAIMVIFGLASESRATGMVALMQISVSDAQRSRVMSTQFLLKRVASGAGMLLIGWLADRYGLQKPMLAAGVLALVAWAIAFANRARISEAFSA